MLNQDKYKTAEERVKAFRNFCKRDCKNCVLLHSGGGEFESVNNCWAYWLALPVEEEKPEPCPFCGGEMRRNSGHIIVNSVHYWVDCINPECMYRSAHYTDADSAIAAHNRVARAVRAAGR